MLMKWIECEHLMQYLTKFLFLEEVEEEEEDEEDDDGFKAGMVST